MGSANHLKPFMSHNAFAGLRMLTNRRVWWGGQHFSRSETAALMFCNPYTELSGRLSNIGGITATTTVFVHNSRLQFIRHFILTGKYATDCSGRFKNYFLPLW